jgi:L-ribulose-5-phosphate 3-epimerase
MNHGLTRRDALTLLGGAALTGTAASTGSAQPAPAVRRRIGIVSRHLQWTGLEDAIAVAKEAGFDAIEWNVRKGGHVAPERVETDLPRAAELTRKAGLAATMITTSIQDAQSPFAEPILRAAQAAGIRWYRGGEYFRYDYARPLLPQLEALKPRMASLVALNRKYGTTWAYHTHSAPGMIGGGVWDIWSAIKDFDPASIGLNFDIGHATARNGAGWIDVATVVAPFIAALAVKDVKWEHGARGWRTEFCPVGEGMIDLKRLAGVLDRAGFVGPINIHYEHSGLLGTDLGTWTLPIARERFLEIVRHDLQAVRQGLMAEPA